MREELNVTDHNTEIRLFDSEGNPKSLWQENTLGKRLRLAGHEVRLSGVTGRESFVLRNHNLVTAVGHAMAAGRLGSRRLSMPDIDVQALILSELQSLRKEFSEHSLDTVSRLAALESSSRALLGNGQPGRISVLEGHVDSLRQWRWRVAGISVGVGCVASFLFHLVEVAK